MHVFICWSGTRSLSAAKALKIFFEELNQAPGLPEHNRLTAFYSPDIDKGSEWFKAVQSELSRADAAVIVVTPENARSHWMHFEAGAVVSGILARENAPGRIFTYLFGMEPNELTGPLAAYQSTVATYADTLSMARQLFGTSPANAPGFTDPYDKAWTTLAVSLAGAQYEPLDVMLPGLEARFERKTFDEPVAECHRQAWSERIAGCHETLYDLRRELSNVKRRCRPYEVELLRQVIWRLDLYEMSMQAYLIDQKHWELRADGSIDMPDKVRDVCERRRREVKDAVAGLLDPARAPVFDESPVFERLETFGEKKNLIHRKAAMIRRWIKQESKGGTGDGFGTDRHRRPEPIDWRASTALPPREKFEQAISSDWCCDRIFYYITHSEVVYADLPLPDGSRFGILGPKEISAQIPFWIEEEIQRIRASLRPGGQTRMCLNYALGLLLALVDSRNPKDPAPNPLGLLDPGAVGRLRECLDAAIEVEKDKDGSEVRRKAELLKKRFAAAD